MASQILPPQLLLRLLMAAATRVHTRWEWTSNSCTATSSTTYNPSASSSGCGTSSNSSPSSACRRAASASFSCCRTSARPALLSSVSSSGPATPLLPAALLWPRRRTASSSGSTTAGISATREQAAVAIRQQTRNCQRTTPHPRHYSSQVPQSSSQQWFVCTAKPLPAGTYPARQLDDTEIITTVWPRISQHLSCNKATTSTLC